MRVDKLLKVQKIESCKEERRAMLARKHFQVWRGERFPDDLASLRKYLEHDFFRLCDSELLRTYKVCDETKQFFCRKL